MFALVCSEEASSANLFRLRTACRLVVPTAADKLAAEEAALAATARRKDAARAALGALLADNAPQAAKDGMAMLRMLVSNLVNQPNVPRYRRIATRCVCSSTLC